ncbi:ribosomal protein S18 acetylase RimI-like enzyme [Sphingobacterium allocomposti]|jgi:GNAT superfamily N-acetyltransferase|uniref:Ribosomal protein S18 acetylase RimI-like enzyme n=1 Tax=Sphingobacterium allocomposti TaxID=415956 RepID=A0A5S5D209_9SPHI|nr:GNAT family N-acetyltransferase [Sphingobacterium composti Yoo et al. 2007 non Ten et al. 2007]TYP88842.1 ribosomal protein S18 acetylase RimI-like enzyme [Sphingobacterium composti Yoo et al. 2007 non Ten et al. 2007]HLS96622.1 GNAT family N-acetyltransferase [Sphingobacterium sp.]
MEIEEASATQWSILSDLAQRSWRAGYKDVLSTEQIEFMLEKSYSQPGILEAMDKGQRFYLGSCGGRAVGFIALQRADNGVLRIEKLYLLPEVQGKGYGQQFIGFAEQEASKQKCSQLELNVNRKNKAYYFYRKQGFEVTAEIDIPYFGFLLDDYIMRKKVVRVNKADS